MTKQPSNKLYNSKLFNIFKRSSKKIALISLNGVIGKTSSFGGNGIDFEQISKQIDEAFEIKNLSAVALLINSPGGSPVQSEMIFKKIRSKAEKTGIPIISFLEDIAASGGYFLAVSADKIYASECSIVGSIGVISSGFGFNKAIEKIGVERRIYTTGEQKSILDPFSPENENDIEIVKEMQKDIYEVFTRIVKDRREGLLKLEDDELFSGKIWSGTKALKIGLIDEIGDYYSTLTKQFGSDAKFIHISKKKTFLKKIGLVAADCLSLIALRIVNFTREKAILSKFGL